MAQTQDFPQNPFELTDLTVEDYVRLIEHPDLRNRRIELVDGRLVEKGEPPFMVSNKRNTALGNEMGRLIGNANAAYSPRPGIVTGADGAFRMADGHVREPDAAYIHKERAGGESHVVFDVAPDIAVEVISPSEREAVILRKVEAYLEAGATIVWSVYDEEQMVVEYRSGGDDRLSVKIFRVGDTLTAPDVLPNLAIDLAELFSI